MFKLLRYLYSGGSIEKKLYGGFIRFSAFGLPNFSGNGV